MQMVGGPRACALMHCGLQIMLLVLGSTGVACACARTLGTMSQKPLRKAWICCRMAVVMRCSATRSTYSRLFASVTCAFMTRPQQHQPWS